MHANLLGQQMRKSTGNGQFPGNSIKAHPRMAGAVAPVKMRSVESRSSNTQNSPNLPANILNSKQ